MRSRIHLAIGAACLAVICAVAVGASEQAQAGAAADENQADAVVATALHQRITESQLRVADATLESQFTPGELHAHRLKVLTWKIIFPFRQSFRVTEGTSPTDMEIAEAASYFRTKVRDAVCGMTQSEVEERLASLEAEAEAARAKQQPRPALKAEIDEVRGYLEESKVSEPLMSFIIAEDWKFQRALHRKYGGRALMGESGPEAIDATRAWLKEAFDRGEFSFANEADQAGFWAQFPTPDQPIPSELKNPAQVFETLTSYTEASAPDR